MKIVKTSRRSAAFTLIEMLVVIGIVGILAALVLGVGPVVTKAKARSKAKAELGKLVTLIESYHAKVKQYPPDNPINSAIHPLFYELMGTTYNSTTTNWVTLNKQETISYSTFITYFGQSGLLNVTDGDSQAKQIYEGIKASEHAEYKVGSNPCDPTVELLISSVPGNPASMINDANGKAVNPWRYNSRNPTHNKKKFDLWIEIRVGNTYETVGNW